MEGGKEKVAFSMKINVATDSGEAVEDIKSRLEGVVGPLFFSKVRESADGGFHFFADGVMDVSKNGIDQPTL